MRHQSRRSPLQSVLAAGSLAIGLLIAGCSGRDSSPDEPRSAADLMQQGVAQLTDAASGARVILLGESTHGTAEFYRWRDLLSRELIGSQQGVRALLVEGDWQALMRINAFVRHQQPGQGSAAEQTRALLAEFERWPSWLWANEEFAALVEWLYEFNADRPADQRVGVYGLDLYGYDDSLTALEQWVEQVDPGSSAEITALYDRIRPWRDNLGAYARHAQANWTSAEPALQEAAERVNAIAARAHADDPDGAMAARHNAALLLQAERHFRTMAEDGARSWNHRANHFKHTLTRVLDHLGDDSRAIVWAHNTHIGDARATTMADQRQRNIGQLAREAFGADQVFAIGFSTGSGEVYAGREWGAEPEVMTIPAPREGSLEDRLANAHPEGRVFVFGELDADDPDIAELFHQRRGQRAVGVTYQPGNDISLFVPTTAAERYDALVWLPATTALTPLP